MNTRLIQTVLRRIRSVIHARRGHQVGGMPAPAIPACVRASVEGGTLVLLHIGKGVLFQSNATGARIWQALLERQAPQDVAEQLSSEYGVPRETARQDVNDFVAQLRREGLLIAASQS